MTLLTSRKTQQDVRLQLDKLDYTMLEAMLRRVIREELDAHEARKRVEGAARYFGSRTVAMAAGSIE